MVSVPCEENLEVPSDLLLNELEERLRVVATPEFTWTLGQNSDAVKVAGRTDGSMKCESDRWRWLDVFVGVEIYQSEK